MQTMKLMENNKGEKLADLGSSDTYFYITPNAWPMKEIVEELGLIKIKNFSAKDNSRDWKTSQRLEENTCKKIELIKDINQIPCQVKYKKNLKTQQ